MSVRIIVDSSADDRHLEAVRRIVVLAHRVLGHLF